MEYQKDTVDPNNTKCNCKIMTSFRNAQEKWKESANIWGCSSGGKMFT